MELRDYLNVLRRRRWLVFGCAFIVALSTLIVSLLQTPTYRGESRLLVSEQPAGAALLGELVPELSGQLGQRMQTQVSLIELRPILERVIADQDLATTPEGLLERTKVTALPETDLIVIEVEDTDAARAADTANTIAATWVGWSRDLRLTSIRAAASEVETRLAGMEAEIASLRAEQVAENQLATQQTRIDTAIARYATLSQRLEGLRISEQLETGSATLVSPAVPDSEPVAPKPVLNTALAVTIGLILGMAAALLADYLDNTIETAEEAERIYGVPILGRIPQSVGGSLSDTRELTVLADGGGHSAESYRILRNGLDFLNFERALKTVLVTSAAPREGKSTVAANLAAALAQSGKKTVLVECDFRRPIIHEFFGVNQKIGLSDVLIGTLNVRDVLQRSEALENLWVLSAGREPPNPSELLGSATMERLIQSLAEWADWVILDTPPLLAVSDATALVRASDGVLLIGLVGSTTREMARESLDILRGVGARVVGVVLTQTKRERSAGYGYHSYYSSERMQ